VTDDDHIDDDQLKQMRSVWLSMRDDDAEPSDRGMAALMAAAREQADAGRRRGTSNPTPSWWAKLVDQLRRPPVLAMATVVVLIGGAVVISQRGEEMRTESEMASAPDYAEDKRVATPPASEPTGEIVAKEQAPGAEDERDRDDLAAGSAAASPSPAPVVTQRPRQKPRRSAGPADQGLAFEPKQEPPAEEATSSAEGAKKDVAKAPTLELATGDDMQPKGGSVADTASVAEPPAPAPNKPVSRKPLPSIEGEDRAGKSTTIAQLVKQCEAAAAKNDCAAVRTIASKIEKQDPSTYRLKVSKNAAVARCLEPPAAIEAAPP
jgi:hypothetical protein